jgi:SagB-type dehydrogenase family enzyme
MALPLDILLIVFAAVALRQGAPPARPAGPALVALPAPQRQGRLTLEEALQARRSVRDFARTPLRLAEVAQLLWAAQGVTNAEGKRAAPSAGALYPLEVYLVAGEVEGLPAGLYRYRPEGHELQRIGESDLRRPLAAAALGQDCVREAPAVLAITGVSERTAKKYGPRAARYVHMESGAAAENVYLEATALGLGTVLVGAFDDDAVARTLGLPRGEAPLCLLPIGRPR